MATHSKESIVTTLRNLASKLGKTTLAKAEVSKIISVSVVEYHFGSLGNALEAAGLERFDRTTFNERIRKVLSDDELFADLLAVESSLGHEPGQSEYNVNGQYSYTPFRRFGKWNDVRVFYRKWKAERPRLKSEQQGLDTAQVTKPGKVSRSQSSVSSQVLGNPSSIIPRGTNEKPQLYGEPIDFRGLRHAPINEQGVVYLFGMVSRDLGFSIESVQQGFPDCEGKYLYDTKTNLWARARIEFEYKSSSFREHGHDASLCDFIVCWTHDWPESPIQVIELRREIQKLAKG